MGKRIAFAVLALLISCPGFFFAQEVGTPLSLSDEMILEQLREISSSLDGIRTLLSEFIDQKESALLIENLATLDSNIALLHSELRGVNERFIQLEVELASADSELAIVDTMLVQEKAGISELSEEALATYDALNTSLNEKLTLVQDLKNRRNELEDTLARRRAQRDALEQ